MTDNTCTTCHGTGEGSFGAVCRDCAGMGTLMEPEPSEDEDDTRWWLPGPPKIASNFGEQFMTSFSPEIQSALESKVKAEKIRANSPEVPSYTHEQREWLKRYEDITGIPAMMDNFEAGQATFYQDACWSVRWYRDHAEENAKRVESGIPGEQEFLEQKFHEKYDGAEPVG